MRFEKIINLWRISILGAVGGLFSSGVGLMLYRVEDYYATLHAQEVARAEKLAPEVWGQTPICSLTMEMWHPLWWVSASVWQICLFIGATLLVYGCLTRYVHRTFLRWHLIGLLVVVGWVMSFAFGWAWHVLETGQWYSSNLIFFASSPLRHGASSRLDTRYQHIVCNVNAHGSEFARQDDKL